MKVFCTLLKCVVCLVLIAGPAGAWAGKPDHAGGGKNGDSGSGTDVAPQVTFEASSVTVDHGGSVDLFWASLKSKSCEATGSWSGRKDVTGSETISSITVDSRFGLTCKLKSMATTETIMVTVNPATVPAPVPTVDLSSNTSSVDFNGYATLAWTAQNATVCHAGGAWQGDFAASGQKSVGPLSETSTFGLTCDGEGGSAADTIQISVVVPAPEPDPAPTVALTSDISTVDYQGTANLTWSSQYASRCYAGGGWSGDVALRGSSTTGPLTSSNTYSLTCEGTGGTAYASVTVEVASSSGTVDVTSPGMIGDGRLDAIIEAIRADYDIPALAVIVTRNGQVAEASATGLRALGSRDSVTLQDEWHLGSLSKAITGTLIATQVEAGVIDWSTRVADVWPGLVGSIQSQYANATLAQLVSHGSGIPSDVWSVPSMSNGEIWDNSSYTLPERRMIWSKELMQKTPAAPLGSYLYSNGGYIVAAAMIETLTRDSWESLVRRQVFDPLGMMSAGFGAPGSNQPFGHKTSGGALEPVPPGSGADNVLAMAPAAGIHLSLHDYAAFMLAHLAGDHGYDNIVSANTYRYLHTAITSGYGVGWFVWGDGTLSHSGTNTLWRSRVRIIPGQDVGIFVVSNADNANAQNATNKARDLLISRASATP